MKGCEVRVLCLASSYPLENILWSKGECTDSKAVNGREVQVLFPSSGYPLENILWSLGELALKQKFEGKFMFQ